MRIPTFSNAAKALLFSSTILQNPEGRATSTQLSTERLVELPDGTPFSLCPVSRPTDLFDIKYVELSKQPVFLCVVAMMEGGASVGMTDPSVATTIFSPISTVSCKAPARGQQTQA